MTSKRTARALLLLLAAGLGTSCSEIATVPDEPATVPDPRGLGASYSLVGTTFTLLNTVTSSVIGPAGGALDLGGGHSLTFPAGAVLAPVLITATRDASSVQVTFAPHGLVFPSFARPTLTFRYAGISGISDANAADLAIIYLNEDGELEEVLGGVVDTGADVIRAQIGHFSTYAMATD